MISIKLSKFQKIKMLLFPLFLYGCNTMEGLGTDIKKTGEAIKNSAEENKKCS